MFNWETIALQTLIEQQLEPIKKSWLGVDVEIPIGQYKGRKGSIQDISFEPRFGICMQIQPYRQARRGNETFTFADLLWEHPDARTFWPTSRFETLEVWNEPESR